MAIALDIRGGGLGGVVGVWQAEGKLVLLAPPLLCRQKDLERSFQCFSFSTANQEEGYLPAS